MRFKIKICYVKGFGLNRDSKRKVRTGVCFKMYSFDEFSDLVSDISNNIAAIYLFTRRTVVNGEGRHDCIYLGETGDISTRYSGHHKEACITKHKANCIGFWWASTDEEKRRAAETDILEANNFPCNEVNN